MKRIVLALIIILFTVGCSSINRNVSNLIFPPYPDSDQRKGEDTKLDLVYYKPEKKTILADKSCYLTTKDERGGERTLIPGGEAALALAIDRIQNFLKEEAERYTASYSATGSGDIFYNSCDADAGINLKEIIFTRYINVNRSVEPSTKTEAIEIKFEVSESAMHSSTFEITPKTIKLLNSAAKVTAFDFTRPLGFDLLAPWTIFQAINAEGLSPLRPKKIDITAQIELSASWLDENWVLRSKDMGKREFKFKNIPINGNETKLDMKGLTFELIPRSQIADIEDKTTTITKKTAPDTQIEKVKIGGKEFDKVKENIEEIKENVITKKDRKFGLGDFSINILITEYDNFAESVKEIGKTIEKNKDNILDRFNKI